jgi:hypothetical protein
MAVVDNSGNESMLNFEAELNVLNEKAWVLR